MSATLRLDGVAALRRGRPLSAPVSLTLAPGTVLGLVGPNGVGKSSLLGAIAQTVPSTGAVSVTGRDLAGASARERAQLLALLAQDSSAPAELTATDVVNVGAMSGMRAVASPGARPPHPAQRALDALGIGHLAAHRIGTLSGGQRQLVQFARVLAQNTPVMLLDEPTAALDLRYQGVIERNIRLLGDEGRVVVVALHDLSLALNACTHILLLDRDGAAHVGAPREVLTADLIHTAYGVRTAIHTMPGGRHVLTSTDPFLEEPL